MGNDALEKKIEVMEERLSFLEKENKRLGKVRDVYEIQNVMSLHEYYHSSFRHDEEINTIWAKAPDVSFEEALFNARFVGLDSIRKYYRDWMLSMFNNLPKLKDDLEPGSGVTYMHTLTTPVIEIAEDGETGKGVWFSPGHLTAPSKDDKPQAHWHWDKYGIDFLKENGKWKIWHFFVGRVFSSPYEKSWVDCALDNEEPYEGLLKAFEAWPLRAEVSSEPLNAFEGYSPYKVAKLMPRLPQPYRTFSETFSY